MRRRRPRRSGPRATWSTTASTGRGGQQTSSVEHPATAAQVAEHEEAAALGEAVQQAQQAEAARKPEAVCRERLDAFHATPLRDRPGVAPFLDMLDFCAYAGTAPARELATLRGDPATTAGFRSAALRFKAHSMEVDPTLKGYDLETPSTWEKSMPDPLHAGQHIWCKATHKSANELVAEVAASFRGTTEQWTERFAAIARLPADEDNEFVRYGPFERADECRYGVRVDLVKALPMAIRTDYEVRFATGEFATHSLDRSDCTAREVYDQLTPTFSLTGEEPRRRKGYGEAPRKEHMLAAALARNLGSCTPDAVDSTQYTLQVLAACESDGELKAHVGWMNDALLSPTGRYSRDERAAIATHAGIGPAHYLATNTPPGQTLSWRQKGDLLQKFFNATAGNPQPLSDNQRRGRATAMHAIWAGPGGAPPSSRRRAPCPQRRSLRRRAPQRALRRARPAQPAAAAAAAARRSDAAAAQPGARGGGGRRVRRRGAQRAGDQARQDAVGGSGPHPLRGLEDCGRARSEVVGAVGQLGGGR